jgi:Overcoming lysogenization defect protein-like, TOPRIM domain
VTDKVVLAVEGVSDQVALEAVAARCGTDLQAEGIRIVPIGGAHGIGKFLTELGDGVAVAGLCDAGEERVFRRALERAGFGVNLTRDEMERLGFYVCVADLEDELIRGLGAGSVEALLEAHGNLKSFRTFQKQPAWRGQRIDAQFRRFLCSSDRRKLRYARFIVDVLEPASLPRPLVGVLAHAAAAR